MPPPNPHKRARHNIAADKSPGNAELTRRIDELNTLISALQTQIQATIAQTIIGARHGISIVAERITTHERIILLLRAYIEQRLQAQSDQITSLQQTITTLQSFLPQMLTIMCQIEGPQQAAAVTLSSDFLRFFGRQQSPPSASASAAMPTTVIPPTPRTPSPR